MLRHRSRRVTAAMAVAALLVGVTTLPSAAYRRPGVMDRVNRVPGDAKDHGYYGDRWGHGGVSASANGRYVVFEASDPDLAKEAGHPGATLEVAGNFYIATQIFRYDRVLGRLEMVSLSDGGVPALGVTEHPHVSDSGRFVVFETPAPNLVKDDTNLTNDVFVRDMTAGTIERVSVTTAGNESRPSATDALSGNEANPSISGDGRYVAFGSRASDLVSDDNNGQPDIFLHDRVASTTRRVSVTSAGGQADGGSYGASVSNGGRYVVFTTQAPNLTGVKGSVVVRHDIKQRSNDVVSQSLSGSASEPRMNQPSAGSYVISQDGRYVAFRAGSSDIVPSDSSPMSWWDVFVRDMRQHRTTRINVSSYGEESTGTASGLSISGNGRFVAFSSFADDLTAGDASTPCPTCVGLYQVAGQTGDSDAFVHDLITGTTERMSISANGPESTSCGPSGYQAVSGSPGVSATGRFVSFWSCYDDMVDSDADNGEIFDVYIRDRGAPLATQHGKGGGGASDPTDVCLAANVCLPPGGALNSKDSGDAAAKSMQGADLYGVSMAHRPQLRDLFVRVQVDGMPAQVGPGAPLSAAMLYGLRFTSAGADYEVRAQRLPAVNGLAIADATFGLFRTDEATGLTAKVATLRGGYGTTGQEVVFAIPLAAIGAGQRTRLSKVTAFSAVGTAAGGAVQTLDTVALR